VTVAPQEEGGRGTGLSPEEGGPGTGSAPEGLSRTPSFMTDFVEIFYGIFFSPSATLRAVAARPRPPLRVALFGLTLVAALNGLAGATTARGFWQDFMAAVTESGSSSSGLGGVPDLPIGGGFILLTVLIAVTWGPVGLFLKTGALSLMSSFFGGRGQPSRLFTLLGLTYLPALVTVPVILITAGRPTLSWLGTGLSVAIMIWRLVLDIIAIREVHAFSTGRAVGVALVPLGVSAALLFSVIIALIALFASIIGPLIQSGLPGVG
jgi:hypothetical protein